MDTKTTASNEEGNVTLLEIENLKKAVAQLENERDEYLNGWKRAKADYQNLLKEMDKKITESRESGLIQWICEFLPISENLRKAVEHIEDEDRDKEWVKGLIHTDRLAQTFAWKMGIAKLEVMGKPFDPSVCEAVGVEESKDYPSATVIKELAPGYKKGDKIIIPAKVIVSK